MTVRTAPQWSTSSFGEPTLTSPLELHALGSHLEQCVRATGRLFSTRCAFESLHGFVAGRLMTTLALLAVLAVAVAAML
jgi:hypothetical protein